MMADNKLLQKLSQSLLEILNDEEYYDITIEVGNSPDVKIFRAHMVILNYRSSYFRRILSTDKKKKFDYFVHIKLLNISSEIFQSVLRIESLTIKSKNIDSKIISFQHVELISKWIDRLGSKDKLTSSYKFVLLYRDTRDGSDGMFDRFRNFHEICDNKSRTLTIIKLKDSEEIIGGYNPIKWKSDDSHGITKDSFIFSLSNDNFILSRVRNDKRAIFNGLCYGPSFGDRDLYLCKTLGGELKLVCRQKSYEKQIRETDATFLEFEVFQIMLD
ncbi:uncharacterized protein OCT59_021234 [Rhizophagus irregularis]|uniref:uncharacterized protein n=1 Tax=Rhizophagus irregularis TaxID=588596 RepID=UPI00331E4AE8|nr:hypothetical protein OCT59_021234 [Rhizophagus irregularis]